MKTKKGKTLLISTLLLLLVFSFGVAVPVQAAEIIDGDYVVVEEDTVIDDDLFIAGQTVEMNGTVTGDVFAAGQKVIINGEVEGNLIASGAEVIINGIVQGSTAASAYSVTIGPDADLQRNLYFGGFNLSVEEGSVVGRSTYIGGYQAVLGGEVQRDVNAGTSAFVLEGSVGGDVNVEVDQFRPGQQPTFFMPDIPNLPNVEMLDSGLTVSDSAEIGGELNERISYVDAPDVRIDVPDPQRFGSVNILWRILDSLRQRTGEFISLVIIGAALLYFVRQPVKDVAAKMRAETLQSGLWGLGVAFLFPLAVIVSVLILGMIIVLLWVVTLGTLSGTAIQIGGLTIGSITALFGLAAWFLTKVVFGYLVGAAILERTAPDFFAGKWGDFASLVLGVLLYEIVRSLPLLGWLVAFIVIVLGLGAIFLWLRDKRQAMLPAAA